MTIPAMRAALRVILAVSLAAYLAACGPPPSAQQRTNADILLFTGVGASAGDIRAVEHILRAQHADYITATSAELNAMSERDLAAHRLLIVPGGDFEAMGHSLSPDTAANVRNAVRSGLNYLGLCGGAFMAGNSPYNGFNLTDGVRFHFYAIENRGVRKTAVPIAVAGGPTADQYWEDGPELSGWGNVVAKYPDGTPAIVEGYAGAGFLILTGIHPEAPDSWRRGMTFHTPASDDNAYAATLIDAALHGAPVAHF